MTDQNFVSKTAFLPAGLDACALYRMYMPHLRIPDSMFLLRLDRLDVREIRDYEVIVVQRQATIQNLNAMQLLRKIGKKVIYDLDDNMWSVPAANPGAKIINQMRQGFEVCARESHLITVSTRGLKAAVQYALPDLKQEILVTPNGVDLDWLQPSCLDKNDGLVVVGWGGSNTHSEDVREAWSVLPGLVEKHQHLWLEFIGEEPPKGLERHPRVRLKNWVPVAEYMNRLPGWGWDISLGPLVENKFNRSKSCIKMLEAAAMKIPCLASNVQPYAEFCALGGKELEWLLCDNRRQWETKLEKLIVDVDYRKYMGQLMYENAKKHFSMEVLKENWKYAIRKAAAC